MRKIIISAAAALALVSCNERAGGAYKIDVTFPDASLAGEAVCLINYDSGDTLAQVPVNGNQAVIEGEVAESCMARLLAGGKRMNLIIEPGEIAVNWQESKSTGTPLNERLNAIGDDIEQIAKAAEEGADAEATMQAELRVRDRFYKAYEENRDNGIGPWAFNYYLMYNDFSVEQLDSLLAQAPERYRNLKRVQKAINAAKQLVATAVGQKFTDFTDSRGAKLSDFAGKGKYTLVDFWASWCGPCRREIPNIKKLYDAYRDKMNFVGVAVWDKPEDTDKAIGELQIPWPVMQGESNWSEPTELYGISGIPHIMLIDPDGVIVARQLAGEQLTRTINELKL